MNAFPVYFASLDAAQIGPEIIRRMRDYANTPAVGHIQNQQALAWQYIHGFGAEGFMHASQVGRAGRMGEITKIRVNHAGALNNLVVSLVNQQRHVWEPRASSTSAASMRAIELARDALDYYYAAGLVLRDIDTATGHGNAYGEGFVHHFWDRFSGQPGIPYVENGAEVTVPTGDVRSEVVLPWNVYRDPTKTSYESLDWIALRLRRNRHDTMARYPDQAEKILAAGAMQNDGPSLPGAYFDQSGAWKDMRDDIDVVQFYHRKCAILPGGRSITLLADGTVLALSDLPVDSWPVIRIAAGDMDGYPLGRTRFWEILGMQQMLDNIHSSISSNLATFAKQNVIYEEGTDPRPMSQEGGLNMIPVRPGGMKPEALQLAKSPEEAYRYLSVLERSEELVVGASATSRGESPGERASGSLAVFLDAKSLQQASELQTSRVHGIMRSGSTILKLLGKYAKNPIRIGILGRNSGMVREAELTGEKLSGVEYAYISVGNPLTQAMSARLQVAQTMIQQGADPEIVERVLTTGQLKPILQGSAAQRILIAQENEAMARGEQVGVDVGDDHLLHVREHAPVNATLEARQNPSISKAHGEHRDLHYFAFFGTDPNQDRAIAPLIYQSNMLVLTGQQPPPPRPDLMPNGQPALPPPQSVSANPPEPMSAKAGMPEMPLPPRDPETGDRAITNGALA